MRVGRFASNEGRLGVCWLVLWISAAVTAAIGVLLLYMGPSLFPMSKGSVLFPVLARAPLGLLVVGMLGIVAGTAGIARARWRAAHSANRQGIRQQGSGAGTTRPADAAALSGLVVAAAALLAAILLEFGWPAVASTMRAGPCDQSPTVACFRAHPEYYQQIAAGGYSTPVSRIGHLLGPIQLAAWPVALSAAATSAIALATGTRHRRIAILGVTVGSITVVGMAAQYLAFLVFGGGD